MRSKSRGVSVDLHEDRYSRLAIIPWWDQALLSRSKVMVVGAGALGNEIVKNLALLGIGNVLIVDFDRVEESNLSRSVLYRSSDGGKMKARLAAAAARRINPDCRVFALNADITCDVGLGVFRWADVLIGGLDNGDARLAVNQACWKVNRPWVDGATESFQGVARVFRPPDGVCFECTLGAQDQKLMSVRNSCGFLAGEALRRGAAPTTPTTSAVIAGIQVQEAVKLLHADAELPNLVDKGYFFDGNSYDCFVIEYSRRNDCLSHETYENIVETDLASDMASLTDVMDAAAKELGAETVVDLPGEMITELYCNTCDKREKFFRLLDATDMEEAKCPNCAKVRLPDTVTQCAAGCEFASVPLAELGFGIMDIVTVRSGEHEAHIEISGDAAAVFGH